MNRKINSQVSPKTAAVAILVVLVVIQLIWWRGLVTKPHTGSGGGRPQGGSGSPGPPVLTGRKDVSVDTLAGAPEPGYIDGPGRDARFDSPVQLALDAQGGLVVADSLNHRIRQIAPNGMTTTLAGNSQGSADGPAATAQFCVPCGVAVGPDGTVYIADTGNSRIRQVKGGQVTTLAGGSPGLAEGQGAAVRFNLPVAIAFGKGSQEADGLTVADAANHRVRLLDLSGRIVGGWETPAAPVGLLTGKTEAVAASGILVPDGPRWKTLHDIPIDLQGESGNQADYTLRHPIAFCPAPNGWFVVDSEESGLYYVHNGRADLIAGRCIGKIRPADWRDGTGQTALFGRLGGIVTDGRGHLYVSDTSNNAIRRITLPKDLVGRNEVQP